MARVIGIPAETKNGERRVVLAPHDVARLVDQGHTVVLEAGAGARAGWEDALYAKAGARVVDSAEEAWAADIVVKVKEPLEEERRHFRPDLTLFCFLHLAAAPELTAALCESGTTAYAFETLADAAGTLPLLAPMSEVAGRAAAIVGTGLLASGRGVLAGGAAGVPAARVVVIGLGVAGTMAARGCRGLDAEVVGVDVDLGRLRAASLEGTVTSTLASNPGLLAEAVAQADLVVAAALVPGARAPQLLTEEHVSLMQPGAVIVDLAIDQGGCAATSRPTTLSEPTYEAHSVVHYCVTNVPGQYPRTASAALSAAVTPWVHRLSTAPGIVAGTGALNVSDGDIVHEAVQAALT